MWLLSDGKEADVDFNIDSYTLLFDLLATLYYIVGDTIEIVYFYRILFIFLILIASNQIYLLIRVFFNRSIALITLIFILTTTAMLMRGLDLRPDLPILVLWLQILVVIYVKKYKSETKMFLIGFLCGSALLFKFKAILIVVVIGIYLLDGINQPHFLRKQFYTSLIVGSVRCV
nr:glycosyltransferase family 39 protein [Vibrio sp. Scap16]